jgi:lysophospholipid acyltransferase (LPLAT)-like uncharacterized protein
VGALAWVFPFFYYAYCWLVWKTCRHQDQLNERIKVALAEHVGVVSLMWHEEVFPSAFAYGPLRGSALASTSTFGRIITRMLEFCGCTVYRGGSSRGAQRRRQVLPDMIRYMDQAEHCLYGLTVDGSHGPVYAMKSGGLVIARACRTPIYLGRTWFSRHVRLRSWDRTAIPLPFGRLYQIALGPYWVPPETTDEELLVIRDHLELELLELAEHSMRQFEGADSTPRARPGFPQGWEPRWPTGQVGLPHGPHDLRPDSPPPWARRRKPTEAVLVPPAAGRVGDGSA